VVVGFTVIVNVSEVPEQIPETGVTVIVAIIGFAVAFVVVNAAMFPFPVAAKPIEASSFDQE
jgi:phosphoribosylcarboxyaminoimidazole (NCAIR) mutase